ncbi:MAG: hypothetical protein V4664_02820 [Patescibacteria group bacterium]
MKTVVARKGGIIENFGMRDIRQEGIIYLISDIAELIDGASLIDDDLGEEIICIHQFIIVSPSAVVALFRIQLIETLDPDASRQRIHFTRYQAVFFQLDPERSWLTWKHVVSFDSRGAADLLPSSEPASSYFFECFHCFDQANSGSHLLILALAWRKTKSVWNNGLMDHRLIPLGRQLVRITKIPDSVWDEDGQTAVFEADLLI